MKKVKKRVLFLCTHNSCRSQMTEGFLKSYYTDTYDAYSAGIVPTNVNPYAVEVMKEIGIDISSNSSKSIDIFKDKKFDIVVTVCDDGLLDGGLLTSKFDGEGVPCQKTLVIDRGVLRNFLYDSYIANIVGVESTGNASRTGLAPYASTPVLEVSNFRFNGGNMTPEELVGEVDEGLLVYGVQGAHSSNPESGEFSVVATPVWKIEDGNVAYAVRGVMLTGVVFDVLMNISALGNNVRKLGQLVAPWIIVEDVRAVGRK